MFIFVRFRQPEAQYYHRHVNCMIFDNHYIRLLLLLWEGVVGCKFICFIIGFVLLLAFHFLPLLFVLFLFIYFIFILYKFSLNDL